MRMYPGRIADAGAALGAKREVMVERLSWLRACDLRVRSRVALRWAVSWIVGSLERHEDVVGRV